MKLFKQARSGKSPEQAQANRALIGNLPMSRLLSSWAFIAVLVGFSAIFVGHLLSPQGMNSILLLTSMMAMASLAQGFVILVGGIDLSIPMIAAYAGIFLNWFARNQDGPLVWLIPVVLVFGCVIGAINGAGVVLLRVHPIVMTMGVAAILEGAIMLFTSGTSKGNAPEALGWFVAGEVGGVYVSVLVMILLAVVVGLFQSYSAFGRRLYAVGNNRRAAKLAGVRIQLYEFLAYVLCGFFASVLGIMITGFVRQAYVKMANQYLLVSIAAVAVGGAQMNGGKGHHIGTLGGAIMLSLLSVILASFMMPEGVRNIVFGFIILVAVIGIREKKVGS
ncbi:MAG: ABC transporter permease [Spirochaetia bacterium]|jgi:ribose transport system permease protein